jgi:hypothetical protein
MTSFLPPDDCHVELFLGDGEAKVFPLRRGA